MCLGIALRKLAQPQNRLADRRVPRKRFVARAAALDVFDAPLRRVVKTRGVSLYKNAVGHQVAAEQQILAVAQQIRHQLLKPLGQRLRILRRAGGLQGEQNDVVAFCVNIDLKALCLLVDLRNTQRAGGELLEEFAAGKLLILLPLTPELAQIGFLLALLVDLPADVFQRFQERCLGHGLEQILLHADLNGLLRKFKVVVAADENDLCLRKLRTDKPAQCKSVHKRHFDVRDQDVGAQLADLRQRKLAVRRISAELKAVSCPVDALAQSLPHDAFVLHQKNLQHVITSDPL